MANDEYFRIKLPEKGHYVIYSMDSGKDVMLNATILCMTDRETQKETCEARIAPS